jgi:hypothetical protein
MEKLQPFNESGLWLPDKKDDFSLDTGASGTGDGE